MSRREGPRLASGNRPAYDRVGAGPQATERHQNSICEQEENVNRPRAADDFAAIRARMEELRREREGTKPSEKEAQRDAPLPRPRHALAAATDQRGVRPDPTIWRSTQLGREEDRTA